MELPPTLVSRQKEILKNQLYRGMMESFDKDSEEGAAALKTMDEGLTKTAEEMVHRQLMMVEISRLSNLKVEDEDVDAEIEKRAEEMGLPAPMLRAEMNKGNRREDLMVQILETKIFDFAKTLVKITGEKGDTAAVERTADSTSVKEPSKEGGKKAKGEGTLKKVPVETDEKQEKAEVSEETPDAAPSESEKKAPAKKTAAKKAAGTGESAPSAKKTGTKKAAAKKTPAEK